MINQSNSAAERSALEGGKDEMVERVPGSNTSALG